MVFNKQVIVFVAQQRNDRMECDLMRHLETVPFGTIEFCILSGDTFEIDLGMSTSSVRKHSCFSLLVLFGFSLCPILTSSNFVQVQPKILYKRFNERYHQRHSVAVSSVGNTIAIRVNGVAFVYNWNEEQKLFLSSGVNSLGRALLVVTPKQRISPRSDMLWQIWLDRRWDTRIK